MEHYSRIRTVGRGAYGIVNLYRRKRDGCLVIIKEIPVEEMTLEERQGALTEVKVLDMLNHPNIIKYYDSFFEDKALMIVMEYAEGGTIFEFCQARNGELLDETEVMSLFVQMVLSLQAIHSLNILHRDLKTQNIMLDRKKKVVKVGDFGISKVLTSKSKANTVVGTPCYISPELCEGKPYDEKSDIWALGCVLYEIAGLRKAFDAANLPALVLKIMRGMFAPISEVYSDGLRNLILSTLHLDPRQRPSLNEVLALPICQAALVNLHTDVGRLNCFGASERLVRPLSGSGKSPKEKRREQQKKRSAPFSVLTWGLGVSRPVQLLGCRGPKVSAMHVSRTQHMVITSKGEVLAWKSSHAKRLVREPKTDARWVPSPLAGLSGITIQQVVSGTSFAAFRSDRGILMTYGSGALGCLGHGDYEDIEQPRIVESLLSVEVANVSAGSAHMATTTNGGQVYTWGCGDNGRLALGNDEGQCCPQLVAPHGGHNIATVLCADDCTFFITQGGSLMASGSNRHNKAGVKDKVDTVGSTAGSGMMVSAEEAHTMMPVKAPALEGAVAAVACGISHTAVLTTSGEVYTFGSNSHGQLGRSAAPALPGKVPIAEEVKMVACGDNFTMAVTVDNKLYGWGKATEGRLPIQSAEDLHYTETVHSPVLVDLKSRAADLNTSHVVIVGIVCKFNIGMLLMTAEPSASGS